LSFNSKFEVLARSVVVRCPIFPGCHVTTLQRSKYSFPRHRKCQRSLVLDESHSLGRTEWPCTRRRWPDDQRRPTRGRGPRRSETLLRFIVDLKFRRGVNKWVGSKFGKEECCEYLWSSSIGQRMSCGQRVGRCLYEP